MSRTPLAPLLHYLRARIGSAGAATTDAQLLQRLARGREEAAFEALLLRHSPLVWGVCRRLLASEQDAEDAFQATFLVLLRQAPAVRKRASVASFLYGVARRVALKARAGAARRRGHELRDVAAGGADGLSAASWREVRTVLDEEILLLPERFRTPLVLCCLEGLTKAEAAGRLGWKEGTLASRLARGRRRLRERLARRGIVAPAAALGLMLADNPAAVPAALVAATQRLASLVAAGEAAAVSTPVAVPAKAAVKTVALGRLQTAVALAVALCVLAAGAGWAAHQVLAVKPAAVGHEDGPQPARKVEAPTEGGAAQARADFYGDPLPAGALVRLGTVQLRHPKSQVAFSEDGKTLISAAKDQVVRSWDVATGKHVRQRQLRLPPPAKQLLGTARLAAGGRLVAAFWDDTNYIHETRQVYVHDASTGKELTRFPVGGADYRALFLSPDGKTIATTAMPPQDGTLRLWDVATGAQRAVLKMAGPTQFPAFSPDGKLLASLNWENRNEICLRLWDATSGRQLRHVPAEQGWERLIFSPDGKTLASVNVQGVVTLLETATLTRVATLTPSVTGQVSSWDSDWLAYSPDGALLAVAREADLVLWDVAARKERRRLPQHRARQLAFAPDGKTLACAGEFEIHLWDVRTGEPLRHRPGHDGRVGSVAVSPDGKVVASASTDEPVVRLWETATGRPLATCPSDSDWVRSCAFSSDGTLLVCAQGKLQLRELPTGRQLRRFVNPPGSTGVLVSHLSADGKQLAAVSGVVGLNSYQLDVWNTRTGELLVSRPFRGGLGSCFTPDGTGVSVDSRDGLTIEETMTGRERMTIPGDLGCPVAFAPDAQLVAVGIHKTAPPPDESWQTLGMRVVEVATGLEVFHVEGYIECAAFSPDGRLLATADGQGLRLWDALTGQRLFQRPWPAGLEHFSIFSPIRCLAFLPDGRAVVTGMNDGTSLVWDLQPQTWPAAGTTRHLGRKDLDALWCDLADSDAARAHRAIHALAAAPEQAVGFLADRLRPVAPPDPRTVRRLLADLDSDRFVAREAAARQLAGLGEKVEPALQEVLQGKPSAELRRRVTALLDSWKVPSGETLRTLRALRVLERVGTARAMLVLRQLATGVSAARETRQARAALQRLAGRSAPIP
jgi:RNA polymerase sigma factor (sigma-70 family)